MSWLDRWARRAATPSAPASAPTAPAEHTALAAPISRRRALQRAGVVAVAAWSTPVLQTALAPAASASAPPTCQSLGTCPPGTPCTVDTDCGSQDCRGTPKVCQKSPVDGTCDSNIDCTSGNCVGGTCDQSWTGGTCASNADCYSNNCLPTKVCGTGANYQPCLTGADCASTQCADIDGAGPGNGGICATAYYGCATCVCTTNSMCTSNNCNTATKKCRQNNAGGFCRIAADCTTLLCNTGTNTCAISKGGGPCGAKGDCTTNSCSGTPKTCQKRYSGGTCQDATTDCYSGHCISGKCGKGGKGSTCTKGQQCLSRTCTSNLCAASANGRGCWVTADCVSGRTCVGGNGTTVSGTCQ